MPKAQWNTRVIGNAFNLVAWSMVLLVGSSINIVRRRTRCSGARRTLRRCSMAENLLRARGSMKHALVTSYSDVLLRFKALLALR